MRGSIERRGSTWSVRLDVGKDEVTGKRIQRRISGFKTKKDAEAVLAKLIAEHNAGTYVSPSKMTVAQYLRSWLKTHSTNVSINTVRLYTNEVEKHIIPALGNVQLDKLTPMQIQNFLNAQLESGRKDNKKSFGGRLSPTSVNCTYRILRCAINQAIRWQIIGRSPLLGVEPPKPTQTVPTAMHKKDVLRLLKSLEGHYLYLPVYIAVHTGLRVGEVLALTWADVDYEAKCIRVRRTLLQQKKTDAYIFKDAPKTRSGFRTVAIGDNMIKMLQSVYAEQQELKTKNAEVWVDHNLVCCKGDGFPLHPPTVTSVFIKKVRQLGFNISFHDLRDVFAHFMLALGGHIKVVSAALGHSSSKVTLDRYVGVLPGLLPDLANKLDALLVDKKRG